ncbi:hypothetical protein BBJ28_00004333 [Nothophytophthora sp. Chile5]|nr:hypothetical protein BBJ28_00004333 [Nothophytophthora sp. Chile5]
MAMQVASTGLSGASAGVSTPELASIKVFCRLRQQNQLEKREEAVQWSSSASCALKRPFLTCIGHLLTNCYLSFSLLSLQFDGGGRSDHVPPQRALRGGRDSLHFRSRLRRPFNPGRGLHAHGQAAGARLPAGLQLVRAACQREHNLHSLPSPRLLLVLTFAPIRSTIFAYGQTGSGKTHTILGPKDGVLVNAEEEGGIISRVAKDLYQEVERAKADPIELTVSFVEIYMEQIRDLLGPNSGSSSGTPVNGGLKIRESAQHGVYIEEMTRVSSKSEGAMMELVKSGTLSRAVASTRMNKDSSRSHTILMISCVRPMSGRCATMYIVDLAGSELVNKTNASGRVLQEAKAINKSLSALSNVIKALGDGKKHVPYRDSKLTRLLQDSLGGTAKTCLILAASCSSYNMAETISTLRFGLRAKEIKNPVVQRHDGGDGATAGFAHGGIIFKELYQRAMEDMEAKNRKIDELQRLLSAKYDENQHADEGDPITNEGSGLTAEAAQGEGRSQESEATEGDRTSQEGDNEEDERVDSEDEEAEAEEGDLVQVEAKDITKLELANQALQEENKRLFVVLEALESKLDEVTVDLSMGKPILSLSSGLSSASENDGSGSGVGSREAAAPSLKVWLESDTWRKSLEARSDPVDPDYSQQTQQPGDDPPNAGNNERCLLADTAEASIALTLELSEETAKNAVPIPLSTLPAPTGACASLNCVHLADAEALSRQIVELKLQLHYLSENARLSLKGENYSIVIENARLKTRLEELEFQSNLCNVACSQLEMKNRACETRLSNQETHIGCLQNSLQEYQGLFKQQIIMSQEKCRLLTDELEFYKKLARCSQESYQHLGGGTSPGRRAKTGKAPSPRKNVGGAPNTSVTSPSSTLHDGAAPTSPPTSSALGTSSPGIWQGFSSLCKQPSTTLRGEDRTEVPVTPLSARAQRFIVKPIGDRAQGTSELTARSLSASSLWKKSGVEGLPLSLDELARSAVPPAPPSGSNRLQF